MLPTPGHEKDLAQLAKVLPHLFARWRHFGDLETLAGLPDGEIIIDVLRGTAVHGTAGGIDLVIAAEMRAGLLDQLRRKGIPEAEIHEATVRVRVDTTGVNTDRSRIAHFDFRIDAAIEAASGTFTASQAEDHVWHSRDPA
jgi:hypothetical protein